MLRLAPATPASALGLTMNPRLRCETLEADFCVVGGGMAGLIAAVAAARRGARTVLLHDRPVLGGNASSEVRMWICGAHGVGRKEAGMELYRRAYPLIRGGRSTFHGATGKSWRHPRGWQAVLRTSENATRALLVAHTFARPFPPSVSVPLPSGRWEVEDTWPASHGLAAKLAGSRLQLELNGAFRAVVAILRRRR
jgi:phytoene dehydrogenase-like protein